MSKADDHDKRAEGAAIATTVIESLRSQPMLLALVVMQVAIMIFIYFGVTERAKREHLMNKFILERCLPAMTTDKVPT
jgi:hypothetical protein